MTENDLAATIIEAARWCGWRVVHFGPARTPHGWRTPLQGDVGFPDLIVARASQARAVELKTERGRLGPGQAEWLDALDGAQLVAEVIRPADLDRLLAELR